MQNEKKSKNGLILGGAVAGALVIGGLGGYAGAKITEPLTASHAVFNLGSAFANRGSFGASGFGGMRGGGAFAGLSRFANASFFESEASSAAAAGDKSATSAFSSLASVASSFASLESSYVNDIRSALSLGSLAPNPGSASNNGNNA